MPADFDFQLAEQLARASDFAYHRDFQRQPELRPGQHTAIDQGTSHTSVLDYPDRVIVAFRGTESNVPDWLKNFEARLVRFSMPQTPLAAGTMIQQAAITVPGLTTDLPFKNVCLVDIQIQ